MHCVMIDFDLHDWPPADTPGTLIVYSLDLRPLACLTRADLHAGADGAVPAFETVDQLCAGALQHPRLAAHRHWQVCGVHQTADGTNMTGDSPLAADESLFIQLAPPGVSWSGFPPCC